MNKNTEAERTDFLTSKVLDGHASVDEIHELENLICANPVMQKRYANLILQESLLHWETGEVVEFSPEERTTPVKLSFPIISSIAACLIAVFSAWTFYSYDNESAQLPNLSTLSAISKSEVKTLTRSSRSQSVQTSNQIPNTQPFRVDLLESTSDDYKNVMVKAIDVLEKKSRFDPSAILKVQEGIASWSRIEHLNVPAENGVLPRDGSSMIKMAEMSVDVDSQISQVQETLQVLDIRALKGGAKTKVDANIFVNNGTSSNHDSTEFKLSVHALNGAIGEDKKSLGSKSKALIADNDLKTWERLSSQFEVPQEADFLVVSLTAQITGPQALLPNPAGNYADQLSVNLSLGDGRTIGPL